MSAPRKVAVLGGGAAAMAAAFELTRPANAGKFDVTVYQMGWRLGGKGASGRNKLACQRIEEHGLHIWMGFYDRAFGVMNDAYAELGRTTGPIRTVGDAFKGQNYIVLEENYCGTWQHRWDLNFPANALTPGRGSGPSPWEMLQSAIKWIGHHASQSALVAAAPVEPVPPHVERVVTKALARGAAPATKRQLGYFASLPPPAMQVVPGAAPDVASLLARAQLVASSIPSNALPSHEELHGIVWFIQQVLAAAWAVLGGLVPTQFWAYRLWVSLDLAGTAVCGIITDDVLTRGWITIDGEDLYGWFGRHGAKQVTIDASPLRAVYDLVFGYADGDINRPQFAAGTALSGMLRMIFGYKGHIFYKMQAGMGDIVFGPLYEVLRNRGVQFRFFHRVEDLHVDRASGVVDAITVTEQVKLAGADYDPLVCVGDLPSWPSTPKYAFIANGEELRDSGIDLESAWARPWKDGTEKILRLGADFDLVVLGISIGSFQYMAKDLIDASRAFANMVANVKTVQTGAFQLWLTDDLPALGWSNPPGITERPVLGAFVEPLDTWADMTHLVPREAWPAGSIPGSIAYFCGVLKQDGPNPPFSDHEFPDRVRDCFARQVLGFLDRDVQALWPNAVDAGGFRWNLLDAPWSTQSGPARFATQYVRVNIDPSERYVLSVPGSTSSRLPPGRSGFANVFLAGDWTQCDINAGCVEGAVTSGLWAAQAILALP